MHGGEDKGILSHLETSFAPSLRDFNHTFCSKRNIIWTIFLYVPKGQGFDPKIAKKLVPA